MKGRNKMDTLIRTIGKATTQICNRCEKEKPITEYNFSKKSGRYYPVCKKCYMDNQDEFSSHSEPVVTIPVSHYNDLINAAEKLAAIQEILG
jgi:transcription elongation factor Elf1